MDKDRMIKLCRDIINAGGKPIDCIGIECVECIFDKGKGSCNGCIVNRKEGVKIAKEYLKEKGLLNMKFNIGDKVVRKDGYKWNEGKYRIVVGYWTPKTIGEVDFYKDLSIGEKALLLKIEGEREKKTGWKDEDLELYKEEGTEISNKNAKTIIEENKYKNDILQSISIVHHDCGNMLNEIKYLSNVDIPKQEGKDTIEKILKEYNQKKEYIEYLFSLI